MTRRIFIAINLPRELIANLGRELLQMQKKFEEAPVKWVGPENLHLTLAFLGEIREKKIKEVQKITERVAGRYSPFEIVFKNCGGFPNKEEPRVIWVGVEDGEVVNRIAAELNDQLKRVGFPQEKREFNAHLTIGRVKRKLKKEESREIFRILERIGALKFEVGSIDVMESILRPEGPEYKTLASLKLKS